MAPVPTVQQVQQIAATQQYPQIAPPQQYHQMAAQPQQYQSIASPQQYQPIAQVPQLSQWQQYSPVPVQQYQQISQVPQISQIPQYAPQVTQVPQFTQYVQSPQINHFAPIAQVQQLAPVQQITQNPIYYQQASASTEHHQTIVKPYPIYIKEEQSPVHTVVERVEHHPPSESNYWAEPEPVTYHKSINTYSYPSHTGAPLQKTNCFSSLFRIIQNIPQLLLQNIINLITPLLNITQFTGEKDNHHRHHHHTAMAYRHGQRDTIIITKSHKTNQESIF